MLKFQASCFYKFEMFFFLFVNFLRIWNHGHIPQIFNLRNWNRVGVSCTVHSKCPWLVLSMKRASLLSNASFYARKTFQRAGPDLIDKFVYFVDLFSSNIFQTHLFSSSLSPRNKLECLAWQSDSTSREY